MGSEPGHPLREGDKTAAETRERMRCFPGLERMLKPTVTPPSLMLSEPHCLPAPSCLPFTSPGQVDGPGPEDGAPPRKREGLPWAQLHAELLLSLGKTLLRAANCTQLQSHKCREVNSLAPKIQLGCEWKATSLLPDRTQGPKAASPVRSSPPSNHWRPQKITSASGGVSWLPGKGSPCEGRGQCCQQKCLSSC